MEGGAMSILDDLLIAAMIDFPGLRNYFLRRLSGSDFEDRFNRAIFCAMREMNEPVNIKTIHIKLAADGWAAPGIASHLAELGGLPWMLAADGDEI
jgi:hypothetical protein